MTKQLCTWRMSETVRGAHQCIGRAGLGRGMAGIADDAETRFGPRLVQRPGRFRRSDHIIAALG